MGKTLVYCLFVTSLIVSKVEVFIHANTNVTETPPTENNNGNASNVDNVAATNLSEAVTEKVSFSSGILDIITFTEGTESHYQTTEFENSLTEKQQDKHMTFRSEASNNRSVHLTSKDVGRRYEATLCVQNVGDEKVKLQVTGIRYSNDGPRDGLHFRLNDKAFGSTITDEVYNGGFEWNVFKDSGVVGNIVALDNGNHTLSMTVTTDQWGVDLDTMTIRTQNQDPSVDIVCNSRMV